MFMRFMKYNNAVLKFGARNNLKKTMGGDFEVLTEELTN